MVVLPSLEQHKSLLMDHHFIRWQFTNSTAHSTVGSTSVKNTDFWNHLGLERSIRVIWSSLSEQSLCSCGVLTVTWRLPQLHLPWIWNTLYLVKKADLYIDHLTGFKTTQTSLIFLQKTFFEFMLFIGCRWHDGEAACSVWGLFQLKHQTSVMSDVS